MITETSAGSVVVNRGKFLLLHYPQGHWDFPKGGIERGETEMQAARRELQEETGIRAIRIIPGFRETMTYTYQRNGRLSTKTVIFFLAQTPEERVRLSHEHVGFMWLSYKDAMQRLTHDNARRILEKAHARLGV